MLNIFFQNPLSILMSTCFLGCFVLALVPSKEKICRITSLLFSIVIFLQVVFLLLTKFEPNLTALQFVESYNWFGEMIKIKFGADGLSMSMILLMSILLPVIIIASEPIAQEKPKLYYSMLMLVTASVMGVFIAQDLFLFFLLWELELVPMYILIAVWGGPNRNYASIKFLIYTFIAGACLLFGTLLLFFASGANTFDLEMLTSYGNSIPRNIQFACFFLFLICFLIKLPSFPFHTWLPDAHVEAPTPISMLLAGVLLKMGGFGIYRICVEIFPQVTSEMGPFLAGLACINIVGAAVACLVQDDMKRVIAYSSVSHMGFVMLGVASFTAAGFSGGVFQMFSHGLISAALFMLVGTMYERTHTRTISDYGGIAKYMPKCFYLFILTAMANLALPALSGFVGESLVFYGSFTSKLFEKYPTVLSFNFGQICVIFSSIAVVLTAAYMLWLLQRVFMGEPNTKWVSLTDLRTSELVVLGILLSLVIFYGVYPASLSDMYEPSSTAILDYAKRIIAFKN